MSGRKLWVIIGVITLLVGSGIAYLALKDGPKPEPKQEPTGSSQTPGQNTPPPASESPEPKGRYIDYNQQVLAEADGRRLLFFYAAWCPQCRMLDKSIKEQGVPDGMTIFKVNYDSETTLKQRYGVTLQTTVVEVDARDNLVKKYVAYDMPTLPAVLNALRP